MDRTSRAEDKTQVSECIQSKLLKDGLTRNQAQLDAGHVETATQITDACICGVLCSEAIMQRSAPFVPIKLMESPQK